MMEKGRFKKQLLGRQCEYQFLEEREWVGLECLDPDRKGKRERERVRGKLEKVGRTFMGQCGKLIERYRRRRLFWFNYDLIKLL